MDHEKLLTYWQACSTGLEHFYTNPLNVMEISNVECIEGKITTTLAEQIFLAAKAENFADFVDVVIAPVFLKQEQQDLEIASTENVNNIIILCLQAKIAKTGEILPNTYQPLPWVPRILTEPTTTMPFSLGNSSQFDNYYHFSPPPWGNEGPQTWQEQLSYGQDFLNDTTKGIWKWHVHKLGYQLSDQVAVIPIKHIANGNNSFLEVAKKKLVWQKVLTTAEENINREVLENNDKKSTMHLAHVNNKHSLVKQQREVLIRALTLEQNKSFYIQAGPGTGKTTIIRDLIASLWTHAIIDNKLPPSIAILKNARTLQKITILDCLSDGSAWLNKQQRESFYIDDMSVEPKSKIIENFLRQCSKEFNKTITNLEEAKQTFRERIVLLQTALVQGIEAACSYSELVKKIDLSYRSYGGIEHRSKIIKESSEKQNSYYHYLEVLQSLWYRQVSPRSKWHKWIERFPFFKRHKTEKLCSFFEKHLPGEDVKGLSMIQMQEYLQELLLRADKKRRTLADILVQIETDLQQLGLAENRLKRWVPEQITEEFELTKLMKSLDTHLRYRLFLTAIHYWEAELLQKAGWDYTDVFHDYYSNNHMIFDDLIRQPVDWLIIENGGHLSPIDGFYCIEGSNRLIVMGEDESINLDRLPMEIDINILKQYCVIETEEDIEELQLKGLLVANGRFNIYLEQIADYKGEKYCLYKQWDMSYKIVECYNQLSHTSKLQACCKNKNKFISDFSYLPVLGYKEPFIGSFRNDVEVTAIINWIKQNEAVILARYPECSFTDIILICTPFYGQYVAFKEACNQYNVEINVELIQSISNKRAPIVIFSPVYTKEDKGMLSFDHGEKILKNLLAKVKNHLLVFGDCQIFDQHLHSASGKFAKFLLETKNNEILEYSEDI